MKSKTYKISSSGVYAIRNKATGKVYVGSSSNIAVRMASHRANLIRGNHHSKRLQSSWIKHGEESFEFFVVLVCGRENLIVYEQIVIDFFHAATRDGYNMLPTAGTRAGARNTEDHNRKISIGKTGQTWKKPPAAVEKTASALRGRKQSPETVAKRALGRVHSPETKEKISKAAIAINQRRKLERLSAGLT